MNTGKIKSRCGKAATCSMRLVSLMFLALFAFGATSARAATPVAVWDGDFSNANLTQNGWTLVNWNETHAEDWSTVTIDRNNQGLMINSSSGNSGITVLVKYSGLSKSTSAHRVLAASCVTSTYQYDRTGITLKSDGTLVGLWNSSTTASSDGDNGTASGSIAASGVMAFTYGSNGTYLYYGSDNGSISSTAAWGASGLKSSNDSNNRTIYGAAIGGMCNGASRSGYEAAKGMTVSGIAVFNTVLSNAEMISYVWPTTHEATIASDGDYTLGGLFTSVNDNDYYVINVNESATLNIDSATTVRDITFNVASGKTLTLTGSSTLTATTINVNGDGMVKTSSGSSLAGTLKGNGIVVYDGAMPLGLVFTDTAWVGTVWIENKTGIANFDPKVIGNAQSTVKLSGAAGYFINSDNTFDGTLEVSSTNSSGTSVDYGLSISDGFSSNTYTINKLTGDGLISDALNNKTATPLIAFNDASEFRGSISLTKGRRIRIGTGTNPSAAKQISVCSGSSVTVASGKTWQADGGIIVNGTLNVGAGSTIPSIVSGSTGVVQITSAGKATISGVKDYAISSSLAMVGGNIAVVDTGITELTIPAETSFTFFSMDNGKLDLSECTSLTTLKLNLGSGTTFDMANVILPTSCTTVLIDAGSDRDLTGYLGYSVSNLGTMTFGFAVTETREEYINGTFSVVNVPSGASVVVARADGTTSNATVTDGTARLSDYGTVKISGVATMYDATFNNSSQTTPQFTYKRSSGASIGLDTAVDPKYNNSANDKTTGLYLRHHPFVNGATSDIYGLTDFTVVVVGQMSPTHKTQFIHIGSTLNSNKGLLIATTDKDDEVIIVPNTGKTVDANNYVKVTVPNAASARHAYVIIKRGNTFTVWVDGIKRGNFTVAAGWEIGSSAHAGVQVGSDFGGEIQRDTSDPDRYKSVANSLDETGVINLIRIFDYVVSDAQAQAIVSEYPYVSEGGLYTRTISSDANLSATDAWAKDGSATTFALPEGAMVNNVFYNPSATMTVGANATLTVNANLTVDTLTVESTGGNTLTVVSNGEYSVHVSGAAVVNSPLRITYGALDLTGPPVQLGSSGAICFDFSTMDVSQVYVGERIQLTGLIERNDEKITAIMPTDGSYELVYNTTGSCYDLVVKGIKIEMEQRAGGANVGLEVSAELLTSLVNSGLSSTATASQVNDFLNAIDPNGLRRWENLATGTATNQPPLGTVSAETANGNALTLSVNMVADTNGINKVHFGYTVLRELRKGEGETWTRVAGPSSDGTALDIGLLNDSGASMNASGLYRVVTLLAYGSVTNEIPSTNAIGIVEVASTATNTITAVPWKRLASAPGEAASDLTMSNFVAFANLSAGDAVYMLDGRAYKMWKKGSDGTWGKATTVSGAGVSEPDAPDVATIPCGGAVWVQRADTTKPYFLVGQYDESAFSVMVPGSGAALIANPFPTNVTLNAIDWSGYAGINKDTIRIPRNGLHVDLSYKNGKWGYYTDAVIHNGVFTGATFAPYEEPIPAGTGFIYDRKGGEGFTFEWK